MLSPAQLIDMCRNEFPPGVQGGKFEELALQAVVDGLVYGEARLRERVDATIWGDGITTRIALTGRQVRLLEPDDWATPTGLNTAGIVAPTAAATYTAGAGGSLPAGVYLSSYAYETPLGVTTPTAPVATTVVASGKITRAAVTPPTGATIADYLSAGAGSGELRRVATGGTGIALDLTAVPSGTAPHAQSDFLGLATLAPDLEHMEAGIAPDGSVSATVTTLTLTTAPDAGSPVRIPYTRMPLMPTNMDTPIALDDDFLRLTVRAHLCSALNMNITAGDGTDWAKLADMYFQQLNTLLGTAAGRRPVRARFVAWV
jgi:hypothetical protein